MDFTFKLLASKKTHKGLGVPHFTVGDWGKDPSGQSAESSYSILDHYNRPGPVMNIPIQGTSREQITAQNLR